MLCCSPTYSDAMERNPTLYFNEPCDDTTLFDDETTLSVMNYLGRENSICGPPGLDGLSTPEQFATSSQCANFLDQCLNSFIQSSNIADRLPVSIKPDNTPMDPMQYLNRDSSATNSGESSAENSGESSAENSGESSAENSGESSAENSGESSAENSGESSAETSPSSDRSEEVEANRYHHYWQHFIDKNADSQSQAAPSNVAAPESSGLLNAATLSQNPALDSLDATNCDTTGISLECCFNIDSIKKEPEDDDLDNITGIACICGSNKLVCDCGVMDFENNEDFQIDLLNDFVLGNQVELDDPDFDQGLSNEVLIWPESNRFDITFSKLNCDSDVALHIPSPCSINVDLSCVKMEFNSFDSIEHSEVVKPSDVYPDFHDRSSAVCQSFHDQEVEPSTTSVISCHSDADHGSIDIKTEPYEPDLSTSYEPDVSMSFEPRLRPIDMVKKDHCYTKLEFYDEPEAPVAAPSPLLWNSFWEEVNEIEIPAKRRPGRPRKSTTSVPVEKRAKVIVTKPPQKRTRKPPQIPAKKIKLLLGSSVRSDKREQHNRAERERRCALRESMFSVAGKCPEHVLHLTSIALQSTKANRSEEVENNFTVEVLRKIDELIKKGDYDYKRQKPKKAPNYSKMVMLLGITYTISSLEKELKAKENTLSHSESILRHAYAKLYKRTKRGY